MSSRTDLLSNPHIKSIEQMRKVLESELGFLLEDAQRRQFECAKILKELEDECHVVLNGKKAIAREYSEFWDAEPKTGEPYVEVKITYYYKEEEVNIFGPTHFGSED